MYGFPPILILVLQLVLTHRLQPVQQHRDGNRAAFNSCLRTGCNFCMLYLEKCGLLPSTRAYAQVATFPTMTGRYRFEPFNSCLRTGCNARHQKERRQKAPSTRAYAQVATLALRGTIVAEGGPSTRAYAQVATHAFRSQQDRRNLQLVLTHRLQRHSYYPIDAQNDPSTRAYAQVATAKLYNKHSPTRINMCSLTLSSVLPCSEKSKSYWSLSRFMDGKSPKQVRISILFLFSSFSHRLLAFQ